MYPFPKSSTELEYLRHVNLSQKTLNDNNELMLNFSKQPIVDMLFRGKDGNRNIKRLIGKYPKMSLEEAKAQRDHIQVELYRGRTFDEALTSYQSKYTNTLSEVFDYLYEVVLKPNYKSHENYYSHFNKHIRPKLGYLDIKDIGANNIDWLMPSIKSNATKGAVFTVLRTTFRLAHSRGFIEQDCMAYLKAREFGITQSTGGKSLMEEELSSFFVACMTEGIKREDILATLLFLCIGGRKMELLAAPWREFNLESGVWHLPAERTKTKQSRAIPLSKEVRHWLLELRNINPHSRYLFPARKRSSKPHMSASTLNKSLGVIYKLFGIKVHGKRHTAYGLLEELDIPKEIIEVCVNHSTKSTYSHSKFFKRRKAALAKLSAMVADHYADATIKFKQLTDDPRNVVVPIKSRV